MKHQSRITLIRRRLLADSVLRLHARRLRRADGSGAQKIVALLHWLRRRKGRKHRQGHPVRRRYASTQIERLVRSARLERLSQRIRSIRPPARIRWYVAGVKGEKRYEDSFPPAKPPKQPLSRRARIRKWLSMVKRAKSEALIERVDLIGSYDS